MTKAWKQNRKRMTESEDAWPLEKSKTVKRGFGHVAAWQVIDINVCVLCHDHSMTNETPILRRSSYYFRDVGQVEAFCGLDQ